MAGDNVSIKFGADLTEFQKAIKEANSAIKDAKNQFELAKASMGNFAKSYDEATSLITKQNQVVASNSDKVKALQSVLDSVAQAQLKCKMAIEEQVSAGKENTEYTKKLQDQLETLNKKYDKYNSQLITASKNLAQSKNTLSEYVNQQKEFKSAEEATVTALGQLNTKITENKEKLAKAKTEYQNIVLSQGKMSTEAKQARDKIKELSTELDKNQKELKESASAADELDKSLQIDTSGIEVSLNYVKQGFYDLAKSIASSLSRALVTQIQDTFTTGINFESAFAGVKKVVDGTEEDFKQLETQIRETAQEKPVSAESLASIYQMGAQLGIAKEDLKSFSNTIIDLKNTSDLTEESAATMIAQYANVMHLPSSEYEKFASTLSYLGSTTATTESRIMEMAQRMSGTASTMHMSSQEVLALSTAMSSVGISAEMGGSAISKVMMNIETEVASNGKNLQTWADTAGMSASEFSQSWKSDVLGTIQKVMKGLSDSAKGGESLTLMLSDLGIENIRTTQTMMQLSSASDLLTECAKKAGDEWENTTFLEEASRKAYDTFAAKLQMLSNAFDEIKISIFQSLEDPMLEAMDKIKKALQDPAVKQSIVNFAKALSDVALKVIQNGESIIKLCKTVGAAIASAFVVGKITAFTSAILNMTNPIGIAINAIALLAAGLGTLYVATDGFTTAEGREAKAIAETTKELEENKNQILANKEAREENIKQIDSEYNNTQNLVNELKTLVDENGNVKKGYEDRVNTIIPLLQNATGQEIQLINNQIVGYGNLMNTLDQVIAKKRLEAKINAYQGDYDKAMANQEEYANKIDEINKQIEEKSNQKKGLGTFDLENKVMMSQASAIDGELLNLQKQKEDLLKIQEEDNNVINKYESLVAEQFTENQKNAQAQVTVTPTVDTSAVNKVTNQVAQTTTNAVKTSTKATKEESKTTYQELLNQEKAYKEQLSTYLTEMKKGNSDVTVEMVEDTNKNLEAVQKKITEIKTLMGDNTVTTKVTIDDESYGGLVKKETELKNQLKTLQSDLAKGNADVTQTMVDNVSKQVDQVEAKIKNLKNEWDESGEDGEISDEFESENTNHTSTGVIFGKGVLGDNAVEMQGAGKDDAVAYYEAYKEQAEAEKEAQRAQIVADVATDTLTQQTAELDQSNLDIHANTERTVAETEQIAHAQGLNDNQYRVVDAEIATLNAAKAAALTIDFTSIGKYICMGIAQGISENTYMIVSAVRAAMEAAQDEAEEDNEIESPSKVYWRYGRFIDLGLANGIKENADAINTQMKNVSSNLQNQIDGLNTDSTIKGVSGLGLGSSKVINYNITQNNTSAKSLDTVAIYNESKSLLKRVVRDQYV